jgi:hypothetical protein
MTYCTLIIPPFAALLNDKDLKNSMELEKDYALALASRHAETSKLLTRLPKVRTSAVMGNS